MTTIRFPVVIEPTNTGHSAYCPDVDGCTAVGDTEEETGLNFQDALSSHFEAMREVSAPIPSPRTTIEYGEIAA